MTPACAAEKAALIDHHPGSETRGDVYYASPLLCQHLGRSGLAGEEHRVQVQVYGGAPFCIGHIGEGLGEVGGEVVDKNVYAAEIRYGIRDGGFEVVRAAGARRPWRGLRRRR